MDISQEEARQSLGQIEETARRARKMVAYAGGDVLFVVWGIIWFAGYIATHVIDATVADARAGIFIGSVWAALVPAGIIIGVVVDRRRMPTRSPAGWRIGVVFWLLYLYVDLWLALLFPFVKVQPAQSDMFWKHLGAIASTVPMFAYVIMGLWLDLYMLWIGLFVTALTLAGLYFLQPFFWLWMAFAGGGTLIGTGLLVRNRWK